MDAGNANSLNKYILSELCETFTGAQDVYISNPFKIILFNYEFMVYIRYKI